MTPEQHAAEQQQYLDAHAAMERLMKAQAEDAVASSNPMLKGAGKLARAIGEYRKLNELNGSNNDVRTGDGTPAGGAAAGREAMALGQGRNTTVNGGASSETLGEGNADPLPAPTADEPSEYERSWNDAGGAE